MRIFRQSLIQSLADAFHFYLEYSVHSGEIYLTLFESQLKMCNIGITYMFQFLYTLLYFFDTVNSLHSVFTTYMVYQIQLEDPEILSMKTNEGIVFLKYAKYASTSTH